MVLTQLESSDRKAALRGFDDLPLFSAAKPRAAEKDALHDALDAVNPDTLAPREALEALYKLKALRAEKKKG
jgi:DNA mismatch repair protein MutS